MSRRQAGFPRPCRGHAPTRVGNTPPKSRKLLTQVRKTRIGASRRRGCVCAGGVAGADSADSGGIRCAEGRGRRPARSPPGCGMAASLWMGDVSEGRACSERTRGSRVLGEGGAEGQGPSDPWRVEVNRTGSRDKEKPGR